MPDHLLTHPDRDAEDLVAALLRAEVEVGPEVAVERTVLDTFDARLHGAGLRLELHSGPTSELVLLDRRGGSPSAHLAVDGVPSTADALPPGPFAARIAAVIGSRALLPALRLSSRVRTGHRRDRRAKATVTVEVHTALAAVGDRPASVLLPHWAAEVHGAVGHDAAVQQVLDRLAARGFGTQPGDLVTLAADALGVDLRGRGATPTVPLEPDEPASAAYRRVLLNLADAMEANLLGTIDDVDPEFLHELRVAVRRSRSVLSRAKRVLPEDVRAHHRAELGWLSEQTGPARDLDVAVLEWDDHVAPLEPSTAAALGPVRAELERRRAAAHADLAAALRSDRYETLVAGWERWLREPADPDPDAEAVGPLVRARIAAAQRRLLERGRAITPDSPPEALHDLRKDAKRLRYLLECFGSLLPGKPRKAFVHRLKALQDNLGAHQDAEVHMALLRELAEVLHGSSTVDAAALLAMGQLTEVLDRRRLAEREDFATRFAGYDAPGTARALHVLLDGLRAGR